MIELHNNETESQLSFNIFLTFEKSVNCKLVNYKIVNCKDLLYSIQLVKFAFTVTFVPEKTRFAVTGSTSLVTIRSIALYLITYTFCKEISS